MKYSYFDIYTLWGGQVLAGLVLRVGGQLDRLAITEAVSSWLAGKRGQNNA